MTSCKGLKLATLLALCFKAAVPALSVCNPALDLVAVEVELREELSKTLPC